VPALLLIVATAAADELQTDLRVKFFCAVVAEVPMAVN